VAAGTDLVALRFGFIVAGAGFIVHVGVGEAELKGRVVAAAAS
jgi:hypothetical protein